MLAILGALAAPTLLLGACSSAGSGDRGASASHAPTPPPRSEARRAPGVSPPATSTLSDSPPRLRRPLHFPRFRAGRCPTSRGRYISTPEIGGVALGSGPVRVFVGNAGDLRHGTADLAPVGGSGWFALKTHFVSGPRYRGPFLVRGKRLDRGGGDPALGARPPRDAPLVTSSTSAANEAKGWRDFPYPTFARSPGCYAWQLDGRTFSHVVVLRAVTPNDR